MSQSLAKTFNDAKGVEHPQVVFYNAGVGNESSWWGQLTGGKAICLKNMIFD